MAGRLIFIASFLFACFPLQLDANEWDVNNIDPELLKDAHSVIRQKHKTYEFVSADKVIVQIAFVVTVLNDKADDAAVLLIHYDEQSKVGKFKGAMYDKNGKQTKRLKNSDLYDRSNVAGYSLYEDSRVKIFRPASSQYPYTVSYSYQLVFNHTAISPRFLPVDQYRQSVESARLNILLHDGYEINYKAFNADEPKQETIKNGISLQWDFNQLLAVKSEAYSPPVEDIFPIIYFMPRHFAYDFYEGSNASWEDFGNWIALLNQGRQQLPDETIGYLKSLVADAATDREKAALIYDYLQKRTRYVNITLGIGGQQPIPANTIDRVGYGDCKALSNYMHAMLQAVGVDSYYTLINSGNNKYRLHEDLPGAQFNHVILCVPEENDTLWLECTSQQIPFGYIGRGNHNRPVLLITDEGGVLGRTPLYGMDENRKTTTASVQLHANGNGEAQIEIVSQGLFYSDIFGLESLPATDQERWIYRNFSFPNYHINKHEIENQKEVLPAFVLHLDIDLRAYARSSSNRLFIPLNLTRGQLKQPERIKNRQHPFVIHNAYNYNDTITYSLPEGFEIESGLQGISLKDDFGSYDAEVEQIDNKLIYTRKIQLFSGRFDAKDYDRFVEFMGAIVSADNRQVVLKKVE